MRYSCPIKNLEYQQSTHKNFRNNKVVKRLLPCGSQCHERFIFHWHCQRRQIEVQINWLSLPESTPLHYRLLSLDWALAAEIPFIIRVSPCYGYPCSEMRVSSSISRWSSTAPVLISFDSVDESRLSGNECPYCSWHQRVSTSVSSVWFVLFLFHANLFSSLWSGSEGRSMDNY